MMLLLLLMLIMLLLVLRECDITAIAPNAAYAAPANARMQKCLYASPTNATTTTAYKAPMQHLEILY